MQVGQLVRYFKEKPVIKMENTNFILGCYSKNSVIMNSKLRKAFGKHRSYFKTGANRLCTLLGCTPQELESFRNTKWYKENRKEYCC